MKVLLTQCENCFFVFFFRIESRVRPDAKAPLAPTVRRPRRPSGGETRTASPSATPAGSTTSSTMYDNQMNMLVRVQLHEQLLKAKLQNYY